jgi:hypothetical protein
MIPARLLTLATRFNIAAVSIAVLCVLLAIQTIRIEGFKLWPLSHTGLAERVADYEAAEKAAEKAYEAETTRRATIGAAYEREASNAAQITTLREREIRTIYRDIEVPAECAVPDSVRIVLSEAVASANAAASGEPVGGLPPATPSP